MLGRAFKKSQRRLTPLQMTKAPLARAGVFGVILGILFYVAAKIDPNNPGPVRFGRAGMLKRLTLALGTEGLLILAAGVFVLLLGWGLYRVTNPTLVTVYSFRR